MEQRNIDGFKHEYPDKKFPDFRHLSLEETEKIRLTIKEKLNLSINLSDLELVKTLYSLSKLCEDDEDYAEDENFNLLNCLKKNQISPNEKVYINFYRFDDVDELALDDVVKYFEYMWYSYSDDIDIFDSSLSWILSIDHNGQIYVLKIK